MRGYDLFKILHTALGAGYAELRCVEWQHSKSATRSLRRLDDIRSSDPHHIVHHMT